MSPPTDPHSESGVAARRPSGPDPWRAEVGALRSDERRRRFPMGVHVGVPGGARRSTQVPWPVPPEYDAGLRLDLMTGLLDALLDALPDGLPEALPECGACGAEPVRVREACAWLTRPGDPVLHDRDLEWYSASVHAFGVHDVRLLRFRAVTRSGWFDVVTGDQRVWRRLRL